MKKFIIAALLSLAIPAVFAAPVSIEAGYGTEVGSKIYQLGATYGNFDVKASRDLGVGRGEIGYTLNISNFNNLFSVNGAIGEATAAGKFHTTASITPTATYSIYPGLTASASYDYRRATSTSINDTTKTESIGVNYALIKGVTIGAKVFNEIGDTKEHGAIASTKVSF